MIFSKFTVKQWEAADREELGVSLFDKALAINLVVSGKAAARAPGLSFRPAGEILRFFAFVWNASWAAQSVAARGIQGLRTLRYLEAKKESP